MLILIIILSFIIVLVVYKKKKQVKGISTPSPKTNVSQQYNCRDGVFTISGYKHDFTINKNGTIEFLIKDGQIIATKDLRVSDKFVYYGGE